MISLRDNTHLGTLFIGFLLLSWEFIGRSQWVDPPVFFPPFSEVVLTLVTLLISLELPKQIFFTFCRSILGLTLASLIAIPVGIAMGYYKRAYDTLNPTVEMLRPIPPAAMIPVALLFLGIHDKMKIAVITFGCIWPILVNSMDGVRNLDLVLVETGQTFNLSKRQFLWEIITKGASPYIFTGIKISLAISLILAVVTEMIAGSNGVGFFILLSERSFKFKEMYAGIMAIAIFGYLLNALFFLVINKGVMKWHQGYIARI